jgi:hypothetical protein
MLVKDPWDWGREVRRQKAAERAARRALRALPAAPVEATPPRRPEELLFQFLYPTRRRPSLTAEEQRVLVQFINGAVQASEPALDSWLESIPWASATDGQEGEDE